MADLLDYTTSPLVLILKVAAPLIFLVALVLYAASRRLFTGKIRLFLDTLILFAFFTVIAGWLRIYADGTEFGFTKEYSLRWFQSIAFIASAGCFIYAGYRLLHLCGEEKP
jgi:ABC-type maltose transport system permease subunit